MPSSRQHAIALSELDFLQEFHKLPRFANFMQNTQNCFALQINLTLHAHAV